jgi:hypothetical protein
MAAALAVLAYLTLSQAAKLIPPSRGGKPTHVATITRLIVQGIGLRDGSRVRLKATRFPGRWMVTQADLDEFVEALTRDRNGVAETETSAPIVRPAGQRRREQEAAARELDRVGI